MGPGGPAERPAVPGLHQAVPHRAAGRPEEVHDGRRVRRTEPAEESGRRRGRDREDHRCGARRAGASGQPSVGR